MLEEDRSKRQGAIKNFDDEISELRLTLEDLKRNVGEVESKKQEVMQISDRRKEVTKSMSATISSLHLNEHSESSSIEEDGKAVD